MSFRLGSTNNKDLVDIHRSLREFLPVTQTPPIVGLLFSASWCPDCWPVVPAIGKVASAAAAAPPLIEIFYVSSDKSQDEMMKFKPESLSYIAFENVPQRSALKKKFGTAAAKEMAELNMTTTTRKHGTPTLILLNAASGEVLTENGVQDVMDNTSSSSPEAVLEKWKALL